MQQLSTESAPEKTGGEVWVSPPATHALPTKGGSSPAAPKASLPFLGAYPCRSGAPRPLRGAVTAAQPPQNERPPSQPQPPQHGEARPSRRHFVSSHGAGSWGGHDQRNNPRPKLKKYRIKNIKGDKSLFEVSISSFLGRSYVFC